VSETETAPATTRRAGVRAKKSAAVDKAPTADNAPPPRKAVATRKAARAEKAVAVEKAPAKRAATTEKAPAKRAATTEKAPAKRAATAEKAPAKRAATAEKAPARSGRPGKPPRETRRRADRAARPADCLRWRSNANRHMERQLSEGPPGTGGGVVGLRLSRRALPAGDQAQRCQLSPYDLSALGYESAHHGDGQWNGVAILSKVGIDDVVFGFSPPLERDADTRLITARCGAVTVSSVYVPNAVASTRITTGTSWTGWPDCVSTWTW